MNDLELPDDQSDDPLAKLMASKAARSSDPLERLMASRRNAPVDPNGGLHKPLTKAQLDRMRQNDADKSAAEQQPGWMDYLDAASQAVETVAAGVPGAKLAISLGRKGFGDRRSLADIQREVNTETSDVPYASAIGRAVGGLAMLPLLPAFGLAGGAVLGGAEGLLNNDPNSGVGDRLFKGVMGSAVGGVLGKGTEMLGTGVRALVSKGGPAAKKLVMDVRSRIADPLYDAVANATPRPLTPHMSAMLEHPDIAPVAAQLQQLEQFRGKDLNDPKLLMEIRKSLTDWGHGLDKSAATLDPSKPNSISAIKDHVKLLKDAFDDAADTQVPGFTKAIRTFADESVPVSGQEQGYEAMRRKLSGGLTPWKNIGKKTPDALTTYLERQPNPSAGEGAAQGILAATRDAFKGGTRFGSLSGAPSLLRQADAQAGRTVPQLATRFSRGTPTEQDATTKTLLTWLNSLQQ